MSSAFLRIEVPSIFTPGYTHAAGTAVTLIQRVRPDDDSPWWVEVPVTDEGWYETLELSRADLVMPPGTRGLDPPDRDELLDGARELFAWVLDDREMYGRVRVSRFETIASWVRAFDAALQLPLPRPNRWVSSASSEDVEGAERAEPIAEKKGD